MKTQFYFLLCTWGLIQSLFGIELKVPSGTKAMHHDVPIRVKVKAFNPMMDCSSEYKKWFMNELNKALVLKDFKELRASLKKQLALNNDATYKDLTRQLEDSDISMGLAQYSILRDLRGSSPADVLSYKGSEQFLTELLTDRELLETILISGMSQWTAIEHNPNMAFNTIAGLYRIWINDPLYARHKVTRNLAVGLSMSYFNKWQQKMICNIKIEQHYYYFTFKLNFGIKQICIEVQLSYIFINESKLFGRLPC